MNFKLLLMAGMLLFGAVASASPENAVTKKMLRHVVLFKFKDSATPAQIKEVEEAFKALPSKIKEIKGLEWGTNNSPEGLSQGFTHAFFVTFDDEAGREVYLPHPDHKAFGKVLGPHLDKVLVIDYWTQE
ncbi:Dabb family protein [Dyadobacter fanqingshengii]|uniref:Dabb family protein n=1 Tax=Dyadobacter fanqingshengii TaxID=2906443 RepID=UPI0035B5C236